MAKTLSKRKTVARLSLSPEPMEAESVSVLPSGPKWVYEPKWDGFRCLALKDGKNVTLSSKSGKSLNRYFPDIVSMLENIEAPRFLLDGELLIGTEEGFSFSALQLRLHPAASRVNKLAVEQPASFVLFDLLITPDGTDLQNLPFEKRRKELQKFLKANGKKARRLILSPQADSLNAAKAWLDDLGAQLDGLVAKDLTALYCPGERIMQKYKFIRTADCVVGGFRYGTNSNLVGSLLLGLYDEKRLLHHVGFTSAIAKDEKPALTKKLEKLIQAPGFTGKAPGGPSRWSTERTTEWQPLKPELVVEVSYDHVTHDRFRHGTHIVRWRNDKKPGQCTMVQLKQPKTMPLDA
jgi:ATP-dependent DNA ligase